MAKTSYDTLIETLSKRFAAHPQRHLGLAWEAVSQRLAGKPQKLAILAEMESTGGEPDVVGQEGDAFVFVDCAVESPTGRRSLCYDRVALDARKENKPKGAAVELAAKMGVTLLTEAQYRALQQLGSVDLKTSSWIATPDAVRKLGGALFCDRRYDQVFVYHNGAESYYAARGFRGRVVI